MKINNTKRFGFTGEQLVIHELIKNSFIIRAQNYTRSSGEIDIIAQKDSLLVFVEVKTRHNPLFDMTELISYTKQKKIIITAKQYCAEYNIIDLICRFDVALVTHNEKSNPNITIIENAFTQGLL